MHNILHIASGEIVASVLKEKGIKNVIAIHEAMCEGDTVSNFFSNEFIQKRIEAYGISEQEYQPFYFGLMKQLPSTKRIELYFDHDMFCVINTITLLAFLEDMQYKGIVIFHLIAQDGTANVLNTFSLSLGIYKNVYIQVLINKEVSYTGIKHFDEGIHMYLEYKKPNNKIIQYIKENLDLSREQLCNTIMQSFKDYGVGDVSIYQMIDKYKIDKGMIRLFEEKDIDTVLDLWLNTNINAHDFIPVSYWKDNYDTVRELLPQAKLYVYEKEHEVQGFIGLNDSYIEGIFVEQKVQSKGIGTQLLDYVKKEKKELFLNVYQKNIQAIHFYKRAGFIIQKEGIDKTTNEKDYVMYWARR